MAYANTFTGEFVWDDVSSVVLHKHVQDPSQFVQLFREDLHPFGRGQGNFYRPLLAAWFMLDYALSRSSVHPDPTERGVPAPSPFLFHVTSAAWHIAASLLFFALLTRLGAPNLVRVGAPLLFALHPLQTEAVAYISGRADPMSAAFIFAGLWFALWEGHPAKRIGGTLLSALCFAAALLSKEAAGIFPALLLICALVAPARPSRSEIGHAALGRLAPLAVSLCILGGYGYLRMTRLNFGADSTIREVPLLQRLIEATQAFALYIRLLFVPTGLHMERTLDGVSLWVSVVGVALLLGCLGLIAWGLRQKRYHVAAGMGWFLAAWLPISGAFPLNAPMAEHWLYLPMAGFIWAILDLVAPQSKLMKPRRAVVVGLYVVCICFLALTVLRNRDWRTNESLYLATLAQNPNSARIHYNLAVTYQDLMDNEPGARRNFEKVIELYQARKAKTGQNTLFWDEELESHLSLGDILTQEQRFQQAAAHYGVLLQLQETEKNKPLIATAAFGMGRCFLAMGDAQHARQFFQRAVEGRPELKEAVQALGVHLSASAAP